MQNNQNSPAQLRQKLIEFCQVPRDDLGVFLSDHPLVRGTVYTLKRKCSKPTCRCAEGERHAEAYRQFRKARAAFLKQCVQRQAAMLRLIDAIGKARTRQP